MVSFRCWLNHGQQRNDTIHRTIPPSQPTLRDPTLKFSAVALPNLRSPCTLVLRDTSLQLLGRLLSLLPTNCPVTVSEVCNKIGVLNAQRHHAVSNTPLSCSHSRKGHTITGADILCTECPTARPLCTVMPPMWSITSPPRRQSTPRLPSSLLTTALTRKQCPSKPMTIQHLPSTWVALPSAVKSGRPGRRFCPTTTRELTSVRALPVSTRHQKQ